MQCTHGTFEQGGGGGTLPECNVYHLHSTLGRFWFIYFITPEKILF